MRPVLQGSNNVFSTFSFILIPIIQRLLELLKVDVSTPVQPLKAPEDTKKEEPKKQNNDDDEDEEMEDVEENGKTENKPKGNDKKEEEEVKYSRSGAYTCFHFLVSQHSVQLVSYSLYIYLFAKNCWDEI